MNLLLLKHKIDGLAIEKSKLTIEAMATIQPKVDEINKKIKAAHAEIEVKVSAIIAKARKAEKKNTGTVTAEADGVKIKHNVPKKVTWDQKVLTTVKERIEGSGDDPGEYMKTALSVDERAYQAWPSIIKKMFEPARTEAPGKPSYQIIIPKNENNSPDMPGK